MLPHDRGGVRVDEGAFIAALRRLPLHAGARGLADDTAVIGDLVLTTDTLVEGVHFLPHDAPADVAWKLVAQNLSDLAAKGAVPEGVLLNYPLRDAEWDAAFVAGLGRVLARFDTPLLGGDTVSLPAAAPRVLTLTALGRSPAAPARSGARDGDALWVTGTIGDAGAGLALAQGAPDDHLTDDHRTALLAAYHRPQPRLADGQRLAVHVHAMCDVSDGLLIDAARIAAASDLAVTMDLARVPLSPACRAWNDDPLAAAAAGDDYQLLFALAADRDPPVPATRIGAFSPGAGLSLTRDGVPVPLPATLGWTHASAPLAPGGDEA